MASPRTAVFRDDDIDGRTGGGDAEAVHLGRCRHRRRVRSGKRGGSGLDCVETSRPAIPSLDADIVWDAALRVWGGLRMGHGAVAVRPGVLAKTHAHNGPAA